jgi:hypothetical protein
MTISPLAHIPFADGTSWAAHMLKIMAMALAAVITRTASLLFGIFIVACKLYFFQIDSTEFSAGRNPATWTGFFIGPPPIF